jgi:proline dehydrogenase
MLNMISFDNTEYAFAYKSTPGLKKAHFLFSSMGSPLLLNLGLGLMPTAIKWNIPFTKSIIRNTIFQQFVGGETLEETAVVANKLEEYNVQVILDYGVEGGADGEAGFDDATKEFIKVIDYAATQANIPFMSIKVTGFVRFGLLEKLDASMNTMEEGTLIHRYQQAVAQLSSEEKAEWERVTKRLKQICEAGQQKNIGVLVDAEETWIQDPVDAITMLMMDEFNKTKAVVYNTIQLYRHDRLAFLKQSKDAAAERNFILGVKIVRGAYMEKERARAQAEGYLDPIQPNKAATDRDYDAAIHYSVENHIHLVCATHNEKSSVVLTELMDTHGIAANSELVYFSQLFGMSDSISFNLANAGYRVVKYVPYGPVEKVMPYLSRRASENSSIAGQSSREFELVRKEMKRRRLK